MVVAHELMKGEWQDNLGYNITGISNNNPPPLLRTYLAAEGGRKMCSVFFLQFPKANGPKSGIFAELATLPPPPCFKKEQNRG